MNRKFIPENEDTKCAPSKKYTENSCFTLEHLISMAVSFNLIAAKKLHKPYIDIKENKKYLVKELTIRLQDICKDQLCWLEQDFVKSLKNNDIEKNTFLPKISQNKFVWLNTTNINEVMEQREKIHKDFKFIGTLPRDFDSKHLLQIYTKVPRSYEDYNRLYDSGFRRIGFIFNHDTSYQDGSHWVALFIDLEKSHIYYFDSFAEKPKKEIMMLIKRTAKWLYKKHGVDPNNIIKTIDYNRIQHQRKNSECGVYSINFILRMVNGEKFEDITNTITSDDKINECRKVYFRFS